MIRETQRNASRGGRIVIAFVATLGTLLVGTGVSSASDTIAGAQTLPFGQTQNVELIGNPVKPKYWKVDLGISERIRIDVSQPQSPTVTVRIFRPGVTDVTVETTKPAYSGTASQTITPKQSTFYADTPGSWIIQASSFVPTTFTLTATQLQVPTENPVTRVYSKILNAPGFILGKTYTATTFDPSTENLVSPRFARVLAAEGDRVTLAFLSTNRRGLRVDVFKPGTTDADVDTTAPIATVNLPTDGSGTTLNFTAPVTGEYLLRTTTTASTDTPIRPTTFTAQLVDIAPPDIRPPCAEEITNIGRTRVKGCLDAGPNGTYITTKPITISGVVLEPVNGSEIVINPETLEVTSRGLFEALVWNIRLPADNYFELSGTQELNLLDKGAPGLQVQDLTDGRSDINGPEVGGLPLTGKIKLAWGLDNGGQAAITANANIPGWRTTGTLAFAVSNDNGLDYARVGFGSDGTAGLTFDALLEYREETVKDLKVDVWGASFAASVGTTIPPATLAGGEGSLEIRNGVLSYVRVGVETSIPIGNTGMFMTRAGLGLRWSPYFAITGFGSVAAGPPINGISAIEVSGEGGYAGGGSCPGSTAEGGRWFFDGSASIAQWFTVGNFGLCYQGVERPFVSAYANAGFSGAGVLEGRASLRGYLDGRRAFLIEGNANLKILGVSADGTIVISDQGLAACGAAKIKVFGVTKRLAIGWEKKWSKPGEGGFYCPEFAPYRTIPVTRSSGVGSTWPVVVPSGVGQVNVDVQGVDGKVPAVEILNPKGRVIARSASKTFRSVDNVLFVPRPGTGEMLIAAPLPKAGTYRIRAQEGSAIETIRTSLPRPDVRIDATVRMKGSYGTLDYELGYLAGRTVEFWEVGNGVGRRIGLTTEPSGTIRFKDPKSLGTKHRIEAVVIDDGKPSPRRTVATFTAPKLRAPEPPTGLRASRDGSTVALRWTSSKRAISYQVRLIDTQGGRINSIVREPEFSFSAPRGDRYLVQVNSLGYGELRSKPIRKRFP